MVFFLTPLWEKKKKKSKTRKNWVFVLLNRFETIWRALDQSGDRKTEKKLSFCFQILKKLRFCFQKLSFFSVFSPYVEVKKPSVRKTSFFTKKKYPWRSLFELLVNISAIITENWGLCYKKHKRGWRRIPSKKIVSFLVFLLKETRKPPSFFQSFDEI